MNYEYSYNQQDQNEELNYGHNGDPTEIARLEAEQTRMGEGPYALPAALAKLEAANNEATQITEPTGAEIDYREVMRGGLADVSDARGNVASDDPLFQHVREQGPVWGEPAADSPLGQLLSGIRFPHENQ